MQTRVVLLCDQFEKVWNEVTNRPTFKIEPSGFRYDYHFQVDEDLLLVEYDEDDANYTKREILATITNLKDEEDSKTITVCPFDFTSEERFSERQYISQEIQDLIDEGRIGEARQKIRGWETTSEELERMANILRLPKVTPVIPKGTIFPDSFPDEVLKIRTGGLAPEASVGWFGTVTKLTKKKPKFGRA